MKHSLMPLLNLELPYIGPKGRAGYYTGWNPRKGRFANTRMSGRGFREKLRRLKQIAQGSLKAENGLVL